MMRLIETGTFSRQTIRETVSFEGIGVHSGMKCRATIQPGNNGLRFLSGAIWIPAKIENLVSANFGQLLQSDSAVVGVTEHLLAALYAYGITDADIVVEGPEIPILDGSAKAICHALQQLGVEDIEGEIPVFGVEEKLSVSLEDRDVTLLPSDNSQLEIECVIDYPHPLIGSQALTVDISAENFCSLVADARTFGFLHDKAMFERLGLARGASPKNSLIFDALGLIEGIALRFPNEPVRHKILDALGDLSLLGQRISGRLESRKGGHLLNAELVRKLASLLEK